ncbi:MAG: RNA polymerase sigma factor [Cyclobacteriaceae bacterium]
MHQELVELASANDRSAQFELYQLYSKAMLNVSFRIVNDRDEAEDVLQESFIAAFKSIRNYRGESSFGSWLKRIVVNNSLNVLKRNRFEFSDIDEFEEVGEEEIETELLDVNQIKTAIAQLPGGFRTVLSLYLLEGYDHREIGEILEISESTSKSQYNRAKKKLRSILKENYQYER